LFFPSRFVSFLPICSGIKAQDRFRVDQLPDLVLGTEIKNDVDIYFEFNAPITTNTTVHKIFEGFIFVAELVSLMAANPGITIYPNPSDGSFTNRLDKISVYGSMMSQLKEEIEKKITIDNSNLSNNGGYYLSGNVIVTNNTAFTIPASSYKVDMGFIYTRRREGIDRQNVDDFYPSIAPNSSISLEINYMPINGGNKVGDLFSFRVSEVVTFMPVLNIFDCIVFLLLHSLVFFLLLIPEFFNSHF
jgi:hypothetical protein